MNLKANLLFQSDKFVIVQHLLLTPCRLPGKNYLNNERKKLSESLLVVRFNCATGFPCADDFDLKCFTVPSRLKIANNPNFVSASIYCSAATARMKTNLLKDNISIQFEGEPYRRTPRVHH